MKSKSILISGVSIAGPALAYWLNRYGFHTTIVERAPEPRYGGYKIDIRGAAVDVVERMGILPEVRAVSTGVRGASYVDSDGKRVANMDGDLFGGRQGDDVEVMRGDLTRVLHEATRGGTEYIFEDSITSITQDERGARVTFQYGEPRTFDLVAGADGLHSNVRALAFGDESQFVRDLGYYVSIVTIPNYLHLDRWELVHAAPGRTVNVYSTRSYADARALFMFASPPLRYGRRDVKQQKQILAEAFEGVGWETPRLLKEMWKSQDFYFDSLSQVHMDRWSNGRVALVGDAAYSASPASGQGTSLALVGAYVPAGELAAASGDHAAAFARYQAEMRPFIEQNQALGPANVKGMVLRSPSQIWIQTQVLRLLPYMPWRNAIIGRVTEAIHRAATAITLKDYSTFAGVEDRHSAVA